MCNDFFQFKLKEREEEIRLLRKSKQDLQFRVQVHASLFCYYSLLFRLETLEITILNDVSGVFRWKKRVDRELRMLSSLRVATMKTRRCVVVLHALMFFASRSLSFMFD